MSKSKERASSRTRYAHCLLVERTGGVPNESKSTAISTPRFGPGSSRTSKRSAKSPDFSRKIAMENQILKGRYCFSVVMSFGESGPERDESRLRRVRLGQQVCRMNRADTGIFRRHTWRRRIYRDGQLAERKGFEFKVRICTLSYAMSVRSISLMEAATAQAPLLETAGGRCPRALAERDNKFSAAWPSSAPNICCPPCCPSHQSSARPTIFLFAPKAMPILDDSPK